MSRKKEPPVNEDGTRQVVRLSVNLPDKDGDRWSDLEVWVNEEFAQAVRAVMPKPEDNSAKLLAEALRLIDDILSNIHRVKWNPTAGRTTISLGKKGDVRLKDFAIIESIDCGEFAGRYEVIRKMANPTTEKEKP